MIDKASHNSVYMFHYNTNNNCKCTLLINDLIPLKVTVIFLKHYLFILMSFTGNKRSQAGLTSNHQHLLSLVSNVTQQHSLTLRFNVSVCYNLVKSHCIAFCSSLFSEIGSLGSLPVIPSGSSF